jgi:transcriptional regulator with GAF, ATPase, and Fis domain
MRFAPLLLEIWREVGRHANIGESIERILPLMASRIAVDRLLIRGIDLDACRIETLAHARAQAGVTPLRGKTELPLREVEPLHRWCLRGEVMQAPVVQVQRELPGLLPAELEGEAFLSPLDHDARVASLMVVTTRPGRVIRGDQDELCRALLEPLAVAVANDRRLRELTSLRESLEADNRALLSRLGRQDITDSIIGADTGLSAVMDQIQLVARSDAPVLILGETGSGKEVVARAIHSRSRRASGPFMRVNCGAIPPELIDSELFGHERGSFTGAVSERRGWFERADGGTLFLDEVGELPMAAQVRLLRILQDGMLERVGGEREQHVDVRIVAATHRDLPTMVVDGRFRQDLWYRVAVFPIHLPPLRERTADIPAMATHFARRAAARLGLPAMSVAAEDIGLLQSYPWPGNVRELSAVIERAAILGGGTRLDIPRALGIAGPRAASIPADSTGHATGDTQNTLGSKPPRSGANPIEPLETAMARHIELALARCRGRIEGRHGTAALLRINPHTLRARMRKLKIDWQRYRDPEQEADDNHSHEF